MPILASFKINPKTIMKKRLLNLAAALLVGTTAFAQLADGSTAPDFTSTDINGNTHTLYADYLNNGMPVIMDVSATWCGPCWTYHESHALKDLYNVYGAGGSNEVGVLFVEGDASTTLEDLQGTGGNTAGDWVTGTPYPILDDANIADLFEIGYYPTIYGICPDGTTYEFGQMDANALVNEINAKCAVSPEGAQNNASVEDGSNKLCISGSDVTPEISIVNHGGNSLTSLTLELFEGGNSVESIEWSGNLGSLQSETVQFSTLSNVQNAANYTVTASMPNGVADAYPAFNEADYSIVLANFTTSNTVTVMIATDNYPGETSWELKDGSGNVLESFGPYEAGTDDEWGGGGPDAQMLFEYAVALPAGVDCYELFVYDSFGDGMSLAAEIDAGFAVNDGSTNVIEQFGNPNFGSQASDNFGADSDGNGNVSVSEITIDGLSIYPNPVNTRANINFTLAENATVNASLVNVLGETVKTAAYELTTGSQVITMDVVDVTAGVYFMQLDINGQTTTQKITVVK